MDNFQVFDADSKAFPEILHHKKSTACHFTGCTF